MWGTKGERGLRRGYGSRRDLALYIALESDTRLRAACGLAKNETEAAIEAFEQLKERGGHRRFLHHWFRICGVDTMRRWLRCGERCPRVWRKKTASDQEKPPGRLPPSVQMVKQHRRGSVRGESEETVYGEERGA
jgi:hypothetical protein